jgi:two-component system, cell cycle sensor histidine kinase and response regulator CckA
VSPSSSPQGVCIPTLLVVDDQSPLRAIIARALVAAGYHVLEADEGAQALALIQSPENHVSLVISDIRMPGMDGYELADRLTLRPHPIPMIFISGFGQTGISLPGSIFLKPFSTQELLTEVRRLLGSDMRNLERPA